jgi:hypothetical protein
LWCAPALTRLAGFELNAELERAAALGFVGAMVY